MPADGRYGAAVALVRASGERLAETLRGKTDAREWLFAGDSLQALTELYAVNPFFAVYNAAVAEAVRAVQEACLPGRVRVLEVPLDEQAAAAGIKPDTFFKGAWESANYDGKLWGIPFNVDVWSFSFVNNKLLKELSPIMRVPIGAPTLVVHGHADDVVPVEFSIRYAAAARAAGDDARLVVLARCDHYDHLRPDSAAWAEVVRFLT